MERGILAYSMKLRNDPAPTRIILPIDLAMEHSDSCQELFETLRRRVMCLRTENPDKYTQHSYCVLGVALLAADIWQSMHDGDRKKVDDLAVLVLSLMDYNYGVLYFNEEALAYFEPIHAENEDDAFSQIKNCFSDTGEDLLVG